MTAGFYINALACSMIFVWATWCVFGRHVRDGIIGKAIFSVVALASIGVVLGHRYGYETPGNAEVALNIAFAMLGLRHITLRCIWPHICRIAGKDRVK